MSSQRLRADASFGNWTLVREIGQGGNGVVWQAVGKVNQIVAIKFLKSHYLEPKKDSNEESRRQRRYQRFMDEILFMQRHSNRKGILPLVDFYLPEVASASDRPWFATPLALPLTLAIVQNDYQFPATVGIIARIAKVLATLHSEAIYHRDIKPDNILMIDNSVFLGDFGLVDFPDKAAVSEAGEILGPAFYIAPEMMSDAADTNAAPADVYSLAKTLWVTATRQSYPLPGEQHSGVPALTLSAYVSDSRARLLDAILYDCTRHNPNHRPTMKKFADELVSWLRTPKQINDLNNKLWETARGFQIVQTQHLDVTQHGKWRVSATESLIEVAASRFHHILPSLEQLELRDFEGNIVKPRLRTGAQQPDYWNAIEWTKSEFPLCKKPQWIGRAEILQHVYGLEGRCLAYVGAIRFALMKTSLILTAAHTVGTLNSDMRECHEVVWSDEIQVDVGYPYSEVQLHELLENFIIQLPAAIQSLLHLLEQVGMQAPR